MKRRNLLVSALCVTALLADLSRAERFEVAFPFFAEPVDVARRVPGSAAALRDYSAEWADMQLEALQQYQGQPLIEQAAIACDDPVVGGYKYTTQADWAQFLDLQPIKQRVTFEQVVEVLGEPLCLTSPYTALWVESSGRAFEVGFAVYFAADHWGYKVTGFRDVELSAPSEGIAGQSL